MNIKGLKIFLGFIYLLILVTFLFFVLSLIDVTRLLDFSYIKAIQLNLEQYLTQNILLNIFLFGLFAVIWVALLGFGSPLLLISGIIFGKWIGTTLSLISISLGALLLFSIASYFLKDFIKLKFENKFHKYIQILRKNEFYYYFIFRLAGGLGLPFPIQNIIPVIFDMKKVNYFFSSFFGFAPHFFIWNSIGAGINKYIKQSESFSFFDLILTRDIYLPIMLFFILFFISILIKSKFFDDRSK